MAVIKKLLTVWKCNIFRYLSALKVALFFYCVCASVYCLRFTQYRFIIFVLGVSFSFNPLIGCLTESWLGFTPTLALSCMVKLESLNGLIKWAGSYSPVLQLTF